MKIFVILEKNPWVTIKKDYPLIPYVVPDSDYPLIFSRIFPCDLFLIKLNGHVILTLTVLIERHHFPYISIIFTAG